MRKYNILFFLLIMSFISFSAFIGCSDDDKNSVDEYAELVEYLEGSGGNFINTAAPAIKSAEAVKTDLTSDTQYLIDIRDAVTYASGHIEGAVNVSFDNLLSHVEGLTTNYESIVIICFSGQTAAYGASLLRLMGYNNVYSMAFGMSSWNADFDVWSSKLTNAYALDFETTPNTIGIKEKSPNLDTGYDNAEDILKARVEKIFELGFNDAKISGADVVPNADNYFVINYWPEAEYLDPGHIPGAYCFLPKTDLHSSTHLNMLPADETIVVYCYTGQTSAYVTAFLKVLGYDAKTLLFGTNGMIYDKMSGHKFSDGAIMNYDYVTD